MTYVSSTPFAAKPGRSIDATRLVPANDGDLQAVARLFEALHAHNSTLDGCFALADGWQDLLAQHF